jgi:hypothetical protein
MFVELLWVSSCVIKHSFMLVSILLCKEVYMVSSQNLVGHLIAFRNHIDMPKAN